jgi:ATP-binding cassette subfamily B protein
LTLALEGEPGVIQVDVSRQTGRILVHFDPAQTSAPALESAIFHRAGSEGARLPPPPESTRAVWPSIPRDLVLSPEFGLGTGLAVGSSAAAVARIVFLGRAVDRLARALALGGVQGLTWSVTPPLAGIVASTLVYIALKRGAATVLRRKGRRLEGQMRLVIAERLAMADMSSLESQSTSEMANTIRASLGQVERGFDGLSDVVGIAVNTGVLLAAFAVLAPRLSWIPMFALGAMALEIGGSYRAVRDGHGEALAARNLSDRKLSELLEGLPTVKSYGLKDRILGEIRGAADQQDRVGESASRRAIGYPLRMEMITLLGVAGVALVSGGIGGAGAHLVPMMISGHLFYPFSNLGHPLDSVNRGLAAHATLERIRQIPVETQDDVQRPPALDSAPSVAFDQVVFGYAGGRGLALRGVDLDIPAGSVVAIVGESGSGKSTLGKLLARFHDPTEGRVTIDGDDIRAFARDDLRALIAVVDQRSYLFEDTIGRNIGMGREGAGQAAIEDAARQSRLHDFILTLPEGYDTLVGVHGTRLSDGQRQRVLIARALLKRAPLLLLDEATSNLDAVTEQAVLANIRGADGRRTVIVVAHRLAAIRAVDKIIVLDKGQVVEVGDHATLSRAKGAYHRLLTSQSRRRTGE